MRLFYLFAIFSGVLMTVTCSSGAAQAYAQSRDVKARQAGKVRVLDVAGLPVGVSRAKLTYVDERRVLKYTLENRGPQKVPTAQLLACYYDMSGEVQCLQGWQAVAELEPGKRVDKEWPLTYGETWLENYKVLPDADMVLVIQRVEWESGFWEAGSEGLFKAVKAYGKWEQYDNPAVL